jgi:hypothetical protein
MGNENFVTITADRYAELVAAEQDAKKLKNFIHGRHECYGGSIKYEELVTLTTLFPIDGEVKRNA